MDNGFNVLDDSIQEQEARVFAGGYAMVTDFSAASILVSRDCQLTIAEDRFRSMIYPVFLQKNSVYTEMVNDVWVGEIVKKKKKKIKL